MKIRLEEIRQMVKDAVTEAKSKKDKTKLPSAERSKGALPGFQHASVLDFSDPLDDENRLKRQGRSNMGPYTSEAALRTLVRSAVAEALGPAGVREARAGFEKLKGKLPVGKKRGRRTSGTSTKGKK